MLADVIGLAFAAFLGPLLLSVLSNNPDQPGQPQLPGSTCSTWP